MLRSFAGLLVCWFAGLLFQKSISLLNVNSAALSFQKSFSVLLVRFLRRCVFQAVSVAGALILRLI
ncbi:hypothetical protein CGH05_24390 [Vibrio parahaemolyticus]|nr:hypothetical protein CGH05_24390 [Vibrio parahaemolyticus]